MLEHFIWLYAIGFVLVGLIFIDMWDDFTKDRDKKLSAIVLISVAVFWPVHVAAIIVTTIQEKIYKRNS